MKFLILSLMLGMNAFAEGNGGERGGPADLINAGEIIYCVGADDPTDKKVFTCEDNQDFCSAVTTCDDHKMVIDFKPFNP